MVLEQHAPSRRRVPPPGLTVADTTEIRWFVNAEMPNRVVSWFTDLGSRGLVDDRTDEYRIDDRHDIGVKFRHGVTLELKRRQGVPEPIDVLPGLAGSLERWRRWSPAGDQIEVHPDDTWLQVHKVVIKRRFSVDGHEVPLTLATRAMTGAGCDVEVASVATDARAAWTFAFAAFGPEDGRVASLRAAAQALLGPAEDAPDLHLESAASCGYPAWLSMAKVSLRPR